MASNESPIYLLATLYTFKSDSARASVLRFVARYPALPPILIDARDTLLDIFPGYAYTLDVKRDPDSGDVQLILSIGVERDPASPRNGMKRLLALQDAWGIDADRRADGRITIILDSL